MVGVPGKYKGCETCRRRRAKCTNERPFCSRCINSGRTCEGFERDRVFITGTLEDRGRVASHPRRGTPSWTSASSRIEAETSSTDTPESAPPPIDSREIPRPGVAFPLASAWDDYSHPWNSSNHQRLIVALQTPLDQILRIPLSNSGSNAFTLTLPLYSPLLLQPCIHGANFNAPALCLVNLASSQDQPAPPDSLCVFVFQHNYSKPSSEGAWGLGAERSTFLKRMGAAHFTSFPNHHYFVRIYRPLVVTLALMSGRSTFLMQREWMTTPWQSHAKSRLDQLLDIALFLPPIFHDTKQILSDQPTVARRQKAVELLNNCASLERLFRSWLDGVTAATVDRSLPYWSEAGAGPGPDDPFSNLFAFRDGPTGTQFLYYWMIRLLFQRCINSLHDIILQQAVDAYPDTWLELPPSLPIIPALHGNMRELAGNICQGLDSVVNNTTQPDILLAPMAVALDFYKEMNAKSSEGLQESMWLESFMTRLTVRGQYLTSVLQAQTWTEIAIF